MFDPKNIDVEKSLSSGWLKGRFPLSDFFSWVFRTSVFMLVLVSGLGLLIGGIGLEEIKLACLGGVTTLLAGFILYQFLITDKLYKVESQLPAKEIRQLLMKYFNDRKRKPEFETLEMLVFHFEEDHPLGRKSIETTVLMYRNFEVHFCATGIKRGVRFPLIFKAWEMKKDLNALLN